MAAARQKEMKVSITEDATMRRTRSLGGATVVRDEAIAEVPARGRLSKVKGRALNGRPAESLLANYSRVNRNKQLVHCLGHTLVLLKQFLGVLHEADEDHHR